MQMIGNSYAFVTSVMKLPSVSHPTAAMCEIYG